MNDFYFVMLTTQNGSAIPLMKSDGESMAFFESPEDARDSALQNPFGAEFGWEVFELGGGVLDG